MLTLQDVIVGKADKVDQMIIDTFRRNSEILAMMPFEDSISAGTGGSTLSYGYMQTKTPSGAGRRDINGEYTASEAKKEKKTIDLDIMGGSYQIDRVLAEAQPDEIAFQAEQKIKSTVNYFTNEFINGDSTGSDKFDGLNKLLTGADTEITSSANMAVTTDSALKANAIKLCEEFDTVLAAMASKPDLIISNDKGIIKAKTAARMLGYLTQTEDAFGKPADAYNGIPFMDVKDYVTSEGSQKIIPVSQDGKVDFYFVKFGRDAVHGVTIGGDKIITSRLPDLTKAGAVKTGDVEFVAGVVLKNSKNAGVLRGVQVFQ